MPARCVYLAAAILACAGVNSASCGAAMTWDGSYQFAHTLIAQRPYVYETRFHSFVLWQPVIFADRFTDNLTVLKAVYGLPYLLAPTAGVLLSWWFVRERAPGLILWAVFGVAIAPLPGQIFVINDSIFQQHLFWPVFLGLLVPGPMTWPQRLTVCGLAAFQLSHQIGCVLMAGAAGATALLAAADRENRRPLLVRGALAAAVAALALVKMRVYYDPYAAQEFTWESARRRWTAGVAGAPLAGLALMWLCGIAAFVDAGAGARLLRTVKAAVLVLVLVAGAIWLTWATEAQRWAWASEYRRWLVPLTFPFFAMALLESLRLARRRGRRERVETNDFPLPTHPSVTRATPRRGAAEPRDRQRPGDTTAEVSPFRATLTVVLAGVFAAVLGVQSVVWSGLSRRLAADVRAHPGPIVPASALPWVNHTPMQHWSLPAHGVVLQGRQARKLIVLHPHDEATLRRPAGVPLAPGERRAPEPGPAGWFDFRPLVDDVRRGKDLGGGE